MTMSVKKSIVVAAPQHLAFEVFTSRIATWWPLASHHIGKSNPVTAVIETRAGGRWFERGEDGVECDWGRVLVYDPPHRLVLTWEISAAWAHDPSVVTEVEVRFVVEDERSTRVELEHRHLERFGDKAEEMRAIFESAGGWGTILERWATATEASR